MRPVAVALIGLVEIAQLMNMPRTTPARTFGNRNLRFHGVAARVLFQRIIRSAVLQLLFRVSMASAAIFPRPVNVASSEEF